MASDGVTAYGSHSSQDGFDLEAGVRVEADERDRLERLCRYVLRPPLAGERLRLLENGDILLASERARLQVAPGPDTAEATAGAASMSTKRPA